MADDQQSDRNEDVGAVFVKEEIGSDDEQITETADQSDSFCPYPSAFSQSEYTMRATRTSVRIFRDYCQNTKGRGDFENFSTKELSGILGEFYKNVTRKDGSMYSLSSVQAIRAGIGRHLLKEMRIDIFHGPAFYNTNNKFREHCKYLRSIGLAKVKGMPSMKLSDLQKLYASEVLNESTPWGLQKKVFVDLLLFTNVNHTRRSLRHMTKDFLKFGEDDNGMEYACIMNCPSQNQDDKVFLYSIPGFHRCPVQTLKKYVDKLHVETPNFWQRPLNTVKECHKTWYYSAPIGHNTLGSFMASISKEAQLSQIYSNSSIRHAMAEADMNGSEFAEYLLLSGLLGNVDPQDFAWDRYTGSLPDAALKWRKLDMTAPRSMALRNVTSRASTGSTIPVLTNTINSSGSHIPITAGTSLSVVKPTGQVLSISPQGNIVTQSVPMFRNTPQGKVLGQPGAVAGSNVVPSNTTVTILQPGSSPSVMLPAGSTQSSIIIQPQSSVQPGSTAKQPNQVYLMSHNKQYTVQVSPGGNQVSINPSSQSKTPTVNAPQRARTAGMGPASQRTVALGSIKPRPETHKATSTTTSRSVDKRSSSGSGAANQGTFNWVVSSNNAIIPGPSKDRGEKVEREIQTEAVPRSNKGVQVEMSPERSESPSSQNHNDKQSSTPVNECTLCGIIFKNDLVFAMHKALHGSEGDFQCNVCKKMFNNTVEFNGHTYSSHK
ncbi:uncharacterized protein [Ptychodera flava]|uniref:uncharacterized protein n=1 Tax=Ptychodera flava TaxID=63121 RepID=UPI00396A0D4C